MTGIHYERGKYMAVFAALLLMGLSGLWVQILLLRELLVVFAGNEFSIGIILANWLILEASGCFLAAGKMRRADRTVGRFVLYTVLFCAGSLLAVLLTRILKSVLGAGVGEHLGLLTMLISSFVILLPASVPHGVLFPIACKVLSGSSSRPGSHSGQVYVIETLGCLIGGIALTFLVIPHIPVFHAVAGLVLANGIACLAVFAHGRTAGMHSRGMPLALSVLLIISGTALLAGGATRLQRWSLGIQWGPHHVVHYQNTEFGNICVVANEGQYIFFLDGVPRLLLPIPDIPFVESFVHIPLLAHPDPRQVLVIGGGAGGVIDEILGHPDVRAIDYAELNPRQMELLARFSTPLTVRELQDPRVRVRHTDGRRFLSRTDTKYDVIMIGLRDPSELRTNRFFTEEFYSLVKRRLNPDGILVTGLTGSLVLMNEELKQLNACVFRTISEVFPYVRVFPTDDFNLYLASASGQLVQFDADMFVTEWERRQMEVHGAIPWHVERMLHPGWRDWFERLIEEERHSINRDYRPRAVFYSISHWNALHAPALRPLFSRLGNVSIWQIFAFLAVCFAIAVVTTVFRRRPRNIVPFSIALTGFSGMFFDLAVIYAFQAVHGYVLSWIGLLTALYMAGSAAGGLFALRLLSRRQRVRELFLFSEVVMAVYALLLTLILWVVFDNQAHFAAIMPIRVLFLLLSFLSGALTGWQFPLGTKLFSAEGTADERAAGILYGADLLGGWLGGIAGGVLMLPVLGLPGACAAVIVLKAGSGAIFALRNLF